MLEVVMTTGAVRCAKLQSNCHHRQTNAQFFYRPDALPVAKPDCNLKRSTCIAALPGRATLTALQPQKLTWN